MIIDAYTHWTPVNFVKELAKSSDGAARKAAEYAINLSAEKPNFIEMEKRLQDLDKYGYEQQITMVHSIIEPNTFNLSTEENLRLASVINDDLLELNRKSKGRILGVGTIPLHALDSGGLEEMETGWVRCCCAAWTVMPGPSGRDCACCGGACSNPVPGK